MKPTTLLEEMAASERLLLLLLVLVAGGMGLLALRVVDEGEETIPEPPAAVVVGAVAIGSGSTGVALQM